jgi:hypothetical protein
MRLTRVVAFVVSALLVSLTLPSAFHGWTGSIALADKSTTLPAVSCQGTWRNVRTPNGGDTNGLLGVSAVSATDAWAVGYASASAEARGIIQHWDGVTWTTAVALHHAILNDIDTLGSADAWAVGYDDHEPPSVLIVRWDGTSWVGMSAPTPPNAWLNAVDVIGRDDVWAVGAYSQGSGYRPLTLHWDGSEWRNIPTIAPGDVFLTGVSGLSPDDVWAVGSAFEAPGYKEKPFVIHWDGSGWTERRLPRFAAWVGLLDVVTTSEGTEIIGDVQSLDDTKLLVGRWNGTGWDIEFAPHPVQYAFLAAITAAPNNDLWLAGTAFIPYGQERGFADLDAGGGFAVQGTMTRAHHVELEDISVSPDGDVWVVGHFVSGTNSKWRTFAAHCHVG